MQQSKTDARRVRTVVRPDVARPRSASSDTISTPDPNPSESNPEHSALKRGVGAEAGEELPAIDVVEHLSLKPAIDVVEHLSLKPAIDVVEHPSAKPAQEEVNQLSATPAPEAVTFETKIACRDVKAADHGSVFVHATSVMDMHAIGWQLPCHCVEINASEGEVKWMGLDAVRTGFRIMCQRPGSQESVTTLNVHCKHGTTAVCLAPFPRFTFTGRPINRGDITQDADHIPARWTYFDAKGDSHRLTGADFAFGELNSRRYTMSNGKLYYALLQKPLAKVVCRIVKDDCSCCFELE